MKSVNNIFTKAALIILTMYVTYVRRSTSSIPKYLTRRSGSRAVILDPLKIRGT